MWELNVLDEFIGKTLVSVENLLIPLFLNLVMAPVI